jgi:hypothetical protein
MEPQESPQDKRLAENEVFFREQNEQVQQAFDEHKSLADADRTSPLLPSNGTFNFYCECADEKCAKRVPLSLNKYAEIHKVRDHFVIAHDHQVEHIEDVIMKTPEYLVVRNRLKNPAAQS